MNFTIKGTLASASLMILAPIAQADQLTFAGGWPPNSRPNTVLENYAEAVGTTSQEALTMRVYPQSLLSFGEANGGLRDGLADVAVILTPYFPTEFPNMNIVSEFAELTELAEFSGELSSAAYAGAISEFVMTKCPDCKAEAAAQNQVFMGAGMTTSYVLQCVVPLNSPEDLKGKRIRTAGAYWSRWAESVGAVPVSISVTETFEALNQGVLDCTASNTADFVSFSFIDAVKYVYEGLPGGQFTIPTMMNKDRWDGLSPDGKTALMKANAKLAAEMTWVYVDIGRNGKTDALERGIEYGPAADSLVAMNRAFIEDDIKSVANIYDERFGIKHGPETSAALRKLMERWTTLIADVDSPEALADIYWTEIYSKIDVASYGM